MKNRRAKRRRIISFCKVSRSFEMRATASLARMTASAASLTLCFAVPTARSLSRNRRLVVGDAPRVELDVLQ